MRRWITWIAFPAAGLLFLAGLSGSGSRKVALYLIGDSTMEDKVVEGNPERGWGQMLPFFLDGRIEVVNRARAGRSTKSFIDEGLWGAVLESLRPGDFVFIQFGHNDEKIADSTRYAEPNGAYRLNLERFIRETRGKNAVPVLLTPVMRRRFDEKNAFFDTHGAYPDVMRKVAAERHVPLIDLHRMTEKLITRMGSEESKKLFLWIGPGRYAACPNGLQDDTHYSETGAEKTARLAAEAVQNQKLPLEKYVRIPQSAPSLSPDRPYLFAYFKQNGQDGLHLAYSMNGLQWTALNGDSAFLRPEAGRDKLMRDPFILPGPDGLFHLMWTVSWTEKGIGHASSKDLMHWSGQRYVPVMEHEPLAKNCWAPEMVYDVENGRYLVFWSTTIPGRFPETDNQSGQGPPEPGLNHRLYCATSPDMQTFSETRLFFDQGFNVIDADIVKDGRRYVMFLKDETNKPFPVQKNIRVTEAGNAGGPYDPVSKPITGDFWAEGPSGIKIGSAWIVYFDRYREKRYGAAVSRNLSEWTDITDKVQFPPGARHGNVFRVSKAVLNGLLAMEARGTRIKTD